jgi:hypothetical protein
MGYYRSTIPHPRCGDCQIYAPETHEPPDRSLVSALLLWTTSASMASAIRESWGQVRSALTCPMWLRRDTNPFTGKNGYVDLGF